MLLQKNHEIDLVREQYKPQYEWLKEQKSKGLLSDTDYKRMVEKLAEEESDQRMDIELASAERE